MQTPSSPAVVHHIRPTFYDWLVISTAILLFLAIPRVHSQTVSGIVGTVTDPSGAVIASASVTATNKATGVATRAITTSDGSYTITDLIPGTYTVKVQKEGFKAGVYENVVVEAGGKKSSVDAVLSTGSISESVEVTAQAISLETEQPELGTTIENKVVEELPNRVGDNGVGPRGRQIDNFLFLAPGVQGNAFSHRINGGVDFENEVVFNGVSAVQSETKGFQSNINPPFEMVNEFRVLSSVFSAQYGLAQGVASYQFASGTNALHGDAFEILRNDMFDAAGAFPDGSTIDSNGVFQKAPTPVDKEHNYGFSVGGPVFIPKLYDGRNKTFFYVSSEWYRLNQTDTATMTVPTPAMKQGDFSALSNQLFTPQNFTPPASCPLVPGSPIAGNLIPTTCFSPLAADLLPLVPDPTLPGLVDNISSQVGVVPTRQTSWGISIDHNLTEKQKLHGSYFRDKYDFLSCCDNNAHFANELSGSKDEPRLGTGLFLTYSNSLSNNLVMTAGLGWMGEINNEFNKHPGVSFPGVSGGTVLPTIAFTGPVGGAPTTWGVNTAGETFSLNRKLGVSVVNNWLWTRGRHTLNLGWEIRRAYQDDFECQRCGGRFEFSSRTTSDGTNFDTTGNSFASFLLGDADAALRQFSAESRLRNFYFAPYIQDNIKITPRLSINAGLRWDILRPFTENNDNVVFFDQSKPNLDSNIAGSGAIDPLTGQPRLGAATKFGNCTGCAGFHHADIQWHNFSPRLGFTYELNNKTVVLGGFALNYLEGGAFEFGDNKVAVNYGGLLNGVLQINSNSSAAPGYGLWDNSALPVPPPTPFTPVLANGTGVLHEFSRTKAVAPYSQAWNFGIQRELPRNMFLSVSYVGNRAIHLPSMLNPVNQLDARFLNQFCSSGDPNDPNCLLSPNLYSWTDAGGQVALQAAGFGQATVASCPATSNNPGASGTFFTPYGNFLCDYGSGATVQQALLPFPMYNPSASCGGLCNNFDMAGTAFYNALQIQTQKRFTNGLSFLVAYTLSRTMSNTDTGFATFNFGALNKFNQKPEWTVASNDQTHSLTISSVYELPIGPGKPFLHGGGLVAKNILGGWQISGILSYASGKPQSVLDFNNDPFGNGFNRANLLPGQHFNVDWHNYRLGLPIFNTAAFSEPGFAMGNSPREIAGLRSAFSADESFALAKHFYFGERVSAELRMEFFNVLNRFQTGYDGPLHNCTPNTTFSDGPGIFGLINGGTPCQSNRPRQGQAFFKVQF
jgi:hypothetical protein